MRGTAASSGIGRGVAFVLASVVGAPVPRRTVGPEEVAVELARFEAALERAEQELAAVRMSVNDKIGAREGEIFAARALVVRDPLLRNQISALIRDQRSNAEAAVADVVERFTRSFGEIPDPYLRERASDIRDVGRRVLAALSGRP